MQTARIIVDLAFAAIAIYVAWTVAVQYRKATGTVWQRLLAAGRESATVLWGKFCVLLSGIVANLDSLADLAGMPELKGFIENWIGNPKAIAGIMLVLALVSIRARLRTL